MNIDTLIKQAQAVQDDLLLAMLEDSAPKGQRWESLTAAEHHIASALVYLKRAAYNVGGSIDAQ